MGSDAKVYLVGAGPGAADLLTLRAARLLAEAEVVFHDALVPDSILSLVNGSKISVGKRCGKHSTAQRFINKRLADAALRHRTVVRLKGGDPMLFGRAHEEIEFLRERGIAVEVVPGVTAALAASAELGVSLTRRGTARSVVFATPRVAADGLPSDWARAVAAADTAVLYMGAGEAEAVREALLAKGMSASTPVALAESVTVDSKVHAGTLADLPVLSRNLRGGPALVMVGDVFAELAQRYLPSTSGNLRSSTGAAALRRKAIQSA